MMQAGFQVRISTAILAMGLIAHWCSAQAVPPTDLKALHAKYEQALTGIQTAIEKAIEDWPPAYVAELKKVEQKLQANGDLEGMLAVRNEMKRFDKEKKILDGAMSEVPVLKDLQLKWRKTPEAIELDRSKRIVALAKSYIAALDEAKKQLTKQGKVDQAIEMKNEIERVKTSAPVTAAEFALANAAASAPPEVGKDAKPAEVKPEAGVAEKPSALPVDLKMSLVLYYSFDRDDGKKVPDKSGKRHDGEAKGAKWTSKGKVGGAIQFDGAGSHVEAESKGLPVGNKPRTMAFWVYPESDDTHMLLIGYGNSKQPDDFFGVFWYMANDRVPVNRRKLVLAQPGGADVGPRDYIDSFKWTHVVIVFDGTTGTMFLNAEKKESDKRKFSTASMPFFIGGVPAENTCWTKGMIDEAMIFDRALTDKEVKKIYDSQK